MILTAKSKQQGASLIELMIALTLSAFLLMGVLTLYLSQKRTYQVTQGLARLQENGRIAVQGLGRDIRMAGYSGCGRLGDMALHSSIAHLEFTPNTRVLGFHYGRSTAFYHPVGLDTILAAAVPATDVLVIQEAAEHFSAISNGDSISTGHAGDFKTGDVMLIANCQYADLFQVNTATKKIIVPQNKLFNHYQDKISQVGRFLTLVYYIADTGRKNFQKKPIYALYRRDLNGPPRKQSEWIEGIDNLQIFYGVLDPKNNQLNYCTADQVSNWQQIRTIKIVLLIDSGEAVSDQPQSYIFLGKKQLAPDRRLRREWDTVIALREPQLDSKDE